MTHGTVLHIFVAKVKKAPMERLDEVLAEEQRGLCGDRYHRGEGSYSRNTLGSRQVTLINWHAIKHSGFEPSDTRRNIVTDGIELMQFIGKEFSVGDAIFRGVKYCDPCKIPAKLVGSDRDFMDAFHDRGGIIAEVLEGGIIRTGDSVIPHKKK